MTIKNINGKEYDILWEDGVYSFLKDIEKGEFLVVLGMEEGENGYYWVQGSCFKDEDSAVKDFLTKSKRKSIFRGEVDTLTDEEVRNLGRKFKVPLYDKCEIEYLRKIVDKRLNKNKQMGRPKLFECEDSIKIDFRCSQEQQAWIDKQPGETISEKMRYIVDFLMHLEEVSPKVVKEVRIRKK